MEKQAKILALSGSTRKGSFNKKLLEICAAGARSAGAAVTVVNLAEYPMPLYDGDLEDRQGIPSTALELKKLFLNHTGLLIASPEYNSSISGVLKNAIDWISRSQPNEPYLIAFKDKIATLVSASPGNLGGLRGLVHLRAILNNIGVIVLPEQLCVGTAHEAFTEEGALIDAKQQNKALQLGAALSAFLVKLQQ